MRAASLATILSLAISAPAAAATRSFPVAGFSRLKVEGPFDVRVRTGAAAAVLAHGLPSHLDRLIVARRGDMLIVTNERGGNWRPLNQRKEDVIWIDVAVPTLQAVEMTGAGSVGIDRIRASTFRALLTGSGELTIGRLDAGRFVAEVAGSGDIVVTGGRTGRSDVSLRGSGDFHGNGLAVGLLTASVTGSGDLLIGPTRVARANLAGSGDIVIGGRPRCTEKRVGSGRLRCGAR